MGCCSSQEDREGSGQEEEVQRLKAEKEKIKEDLEEELKAEKRRHYIEEQRLLKALSFTQKQLEDTKAEMEEMKKNFEDQLRGAAEKTKPYIQDQVQEVRRDLTIEVERGVGNLCGTHIEEEGLKASILNENFQLDSSSSKQQGEPEETEDRKPSLDNFEFLKKLGEGGYGVVILAKGRLPGGPNKEYAIKALKKEGITSSRSCAIFTEKEALQISSGCPFITMLYACFQNKDHLFFIMDYVSEGDLSYQLKKVEVFSQKRTQFYTAEIILALQYIHKKGIIHRDLKLENILLDSDGHCKVADFGLAKLRCYTNDRTNSQCGTLLYMAPEVLKGLPYGHAVDWWALGVMVFEMLTGKPPYDCDDDSLDGGDDEDSDAYFEKFIEKLYNKMVTGEVDFPEDLSPAAVSLVMKLLKMNPLERLGADGSEDTVRQQPFFEGIDWRALEEKRVKPPEMEKKPEEDMNTFTDVLKPDTSAPKPEEDMDTFSDVLKPNTKALINQDLFKGFTYWRRY